jgi:hypothetical protein
MSKKSNKSVEECSALCLCKEDDSDSNYTLLDDLLLGVEADVDETYRELY